MAFNIQQIQFLQRLVADKPGRRRAGDAARYLSEHHYLGTIVGREVFYRAEHWSLAQQLLSTSDLPVAALGKGNQRPTRADVAAFGGLSEKALSARPHDDSVAIQCLGGCSLDGQEMRSPPGAYLVVRQEQGLRIGCDRILLVENFETFRRLNEYSWLDLQALRVLVVYRGDQRLPISQAAALINKRREPIWAMVDFDPAGLVIANALPTQRLEQVMLPQLDWLRANAVTHHGKYLYSQQTPQASQVLGKTTHRQISMLWELLQKLQSGITQEAMRWAR
ncbi:hypothetical protein ACFO3A_03265 [Comamonas nitrativorans]|uniref:DUF7281 domain-containing protein n=1 Tax=Comamonas nitrativorans TaxID=108437 RepID=A0ABV9GTA3_9BURK